MNQTDFFPSSASSASKTKQFKKGTFVDENGMEISIIDTCGFGDTELPAREVLYQIARACNEFVDTGISQVFFVTQNRIDEADFAAYEGLVNTLFSDKIKPYITIVRAKYPSFQDATRCHEDIDSMLNNKYAKPILDASGGKVVHIDVDEDSPADAFEPSRQVLLRHVHDHCSHSSYHLDDDWKRVGERIKNYTTKVEDLERKLAECMAEIASLERQIQEGSAGNIPQLLDAINQTNKSIREMQGKIASLQENMAKDAEQEIRQCRNPRRGNSFVDGIKKVGEVVGTVVSVAKTCSIQ